MKNSKEYMRDYQSKRRNSLYIEFFGKPLKITLLQLKTLNKILKICENFNVKNFTELVKNFTENVKNFTISDVKNLTKDDVKNFTECKELDTTSQPHPITNEPDNSRISSAFGTSENGENSASYAGVGGEGGVLLNNNTIRNTGTLSGNSTLYLKEKNIKKRKENLQKPESEYSQEFLKFYEFYPKKKGKASAWKAWQKTAKCRPDIGVLIACIALEGRSEQWQKNYGDFIPFPSTWINQKRWEDYDEYQITTEINRLARLKAKQEQAAQIPTQPQKEPLNANVAQILEKAGVTKEIWYAMCDKDGKKAMEFAATKLNLAAMEINTFFEEKKKI